MILRKSTKSGYPRWRSRAELLRSYLDSLSPDELRKVRPAYYWLRYGQEAWNRECARKANFNPDQPRDDFGLAGRPRALAKVWTKICPKVSWLLGGEGDPSPFVWRNMRLTD